MLGIWMGLTVAHAVDPVPDVCRGYRPSEHRARSWFDRPNADPWPGLTVGTDTATWNRLVRTLERGLLPLRGSVRPEELVQALPMDAPPPPGGQALVVRTEIAMSPWGADTAVVRVALTGRRPRFLDRPQAHVVLVVDEEVRDREALEVARGATRALVDGLRFDDEVSIVTSGWGSRLLLPPTPAEDAVEVMSALGRIAVTEDGDLPQAMHLAYDLMADRPRTDLRRVLVVSDGDLDVVSSDIALTELVTDGALDGIGLVALGFGERYGRDDSLEGLARVAGGPILHLSYPYDGQTLAEHIGPVLEPATTDTRILVDWNTDVVQGVHRIGNHLDRLSGIGAEGGSVGGELGVGQTATVLYEVSLIPGARPADLGRVKVRASPAGQGPQDRHATLAFPDQSFEDASSDLRIAVAAASLGELLAGQQSLQRISPHAVAALAAEAARPEYDRDRELVALAAQAANLLAIRQTCPLR